MYVCFECTAPLNRRRGSPTTTRLLCIIANSPSPGSYSAVVGKEKGPQREPIQPCARRDCDRTDSFTPRDCLQPEETHRAEPQRERTDPELSRSHRAPFLCCFFFFFFFWGHLKIAHGGSMKTQEGCSLSTPGKDSLRSHMVTDTHGSGGGGGYRLHQVMFSQLFQRVCCSIN